MTFTLSGSICENHEFRCSNNKCINSSLTCNSKDDCGDNSDEKTDCICEDNEFRCPNSTCIHFSLTCNGKNDCGDNSDEDIGGFRCLGKFYN